MVDSLSNMPDIRLTLSLFFVAAGVIPLGARLELFSGSLLLPYVILLALFILLVYLAYEGFHDVLVLVLTCFLTVAILTAFNSHVPWGQLAQYDQHITGHWVSEIVSQGELPPPDSENLRGNVKISNVPITYVYLSIVSILIGEKTIYVVRVAPVFLLAFFPLVGFIIPESDRIWSGIIWLSPALAGWTTTNTQMFVLPFFGILIYSVRVSSYRSYTLFLIISLIIPLTHTLTAYLGLVSIVTIWGTGIVWRDERISTEALLIGTTTFLIWVETQNRLVLVKIAALLSLPLQRDNLHIIGGGNTVERNVGNPLSTQIPHFTEYWISQYLHLFVFATLGILVVLIVFKAGDLLAWLKSWEPPFFVASSGAVLLFSVVFTIYSIDRAWMLLSLFAGIIIPYLFQEITDLERYVPERVLMTGIIGAAGLSLILVTLFYHLSTSGPLPIGILVFGLVSGIGMQVPFFFAVVSQRYNFTMSSPMTIELGVASSMKTILVVCIVLLLLANTIQFPQGVEPAIFSQDERDNERISPISQTYHEPWEYSTAEFLSVYTEEWVVGDIRIYILEEFYRRQVVNEYQCYIDECKYSYIVWFDSYREVWQSVDQYGPAYGKFDESYLSAQRSAIYDAGPAKVYYSKRSEI